MYKIIQVLLFVSVLSFQSLYAQVWQDLGDISGDAFYRHDDVYFTSPQVGYTVYYSANPDVKIGTIFKTTNAGQSWNAAKVSDGTHFRCITFMDDQIGIAGNLGKGSFDNTSDTIPIYRTTDSGQTWTGINPDPTNLKGLCALFKVNDNTIYGAGRVRGPAHLVKSIDKGATWTVIDLLATAGLGAATDLYFTSPDTGFVIGMNATPFTTGTTATYKGKVVYTTNGGLTWSTVLEEPLNPTYFWKISFPTKTTGYVSLQQNTATFQSVVYYKTTNSGQNWVRNEIPTALFGAPVNFRAQGIGFVNENRGWIGGGGFATNFLETLDGGTTWSNLTTTFSFRVNKIRFFGDYAYSAGIRVHRWFDPLATDEDQKLESSVLLYPNPCIDVVHIKLNADVWKQAVVSVHSVTGAELKSQTIENESSVSMPGFKSGVYFVRVKAGERLWIRRIVRE